MAYEKNSGIQTVGELFRRIFSKFSQMENKKFLYKELKDLTLIEINTILVIGQEDRIKSMSQIAGALGVTSGTPTITVDRLITKGYVERIRDMEDRRQVFVKLSEKGARVYRVILALKAKVTEKIFGILDEEEQKVLVKVLTKIDNRFEELFRKED